MNSESSEGARLGVFRILAQAGRLNAVQAVKENPISPSSHIPAFWSQQK
jgi:hypothetical protein